MRKLLIAAAVVVATGLAGCGGGNGATPARDVRPVAAPAPVTASPTTAAPEPAAALVSSSTPDELSWQNGVYIKAIGIEKFQTSPTAGGVQVIGQAAVKLHLTMHNGSRSQLNLDMAQFKMRSGAAGNVGSRVFDFDQGIDQGFTGVLPPGEDATAWVAFTVNEQDINPVAFSAAPGFQYVWKTLHAFV